MLRADGARGLEPLPPTPGVPPAGLEYDLVSSLCHDLRAPLASIVVGAGLLRKILRPEEATALRMVDTIHRSADRLTHLLTTFHDLGRLQSHELALSVLLNDVGAIASTAFDEFVHEATAQGVSATFERGPGNLQASCDRARLVQALRLLAVCMLRIVPDGWTITLRADVETTNAVRIGVHGERGGPGCRSVVAELPKPELAIARGLIDLHHGRLDVTGDADRVVLSATIPRRMP
jgi:K+-sensing histidine kinase KdpD